MVYKSGVQSANAGTKKKKDQRGKKDRAEKSALD